MIASAPGFCRKWAKTAQNRSDTAHVLLYSPDGSLLQCLTSGLPSIGGYADSTNDCNAVREKDTPHSLGDPS